MNNGDGRKYPGYSLSKREIKHLEADERDARTSPAKRRNFARANGYSRISQMPHHVRILALADLRYSILAENAREKQVSIDPGKTTGIAITE